MAGIEQDGTVKSILDSLTHIPIAELTPDLEAPGSRSVKAVVTLTWPYSSATGAVAFLLAEPDFRLRRNKGQVRAQFSGSSAKVIAKSGIASGDEVVLSLDGVEWINDASVSLNATPGRGVDFELKFTEKLLLQFCPEGSQEIKYINVDHPDPEPTPTPAVPTSQPRSQAEAEIATVTSTMTATEELPIPDVTIISSPFMGRWPVPMTEEFSSPAFIKRARTSYGSLFEADYDPFEQEDGSVRGKGRKRTRLSTSWRLTSRSPSPSPELEEPTLIGTENSTVEAKINEETSMMDEAVQTMEVDTSLDSSSLAQPEQTLAKIHTVGIQDIESTERVDSERSVQSPVTHTTGRKDIALAGPQENHSSLLDVPIEGPRIVFDDAPSENLPSSPELRPQSSEGLPLVSPLVTKRFEMFHNDIPKNSNIVDGNTASLEDDHRQAMNSKEDDLYNASSQPNFASEIINFQDAAATYGDNTPFHHVDPSITSSGPGQFVVEESAQQRSEHNIADASSPAPAPEDKYDADRTDDADKIDDEDHLHYPDPEQIDHHSSDWQAQPHATYPDPEDRHSHSAGHSPYPLLPRMDRSTSAQSQAVDLAEDDDHNDEDAEGYSDEDIENDGNHYVPNARYRVEQNEEARQNNEEFDEGEDEDGGYDQEGEYMSEEGRPKYPADYEEYSDGYGYDENDEDDGQKSYDKNSSEKDYGSGEDFDDEDEESYSEEDMDDSAPPPQRQPQGEPEVIDLLSSDEEDAEDGASESVPPPSQNVHLSEPRQESDDERSESDYGDEEENGRQDEESNVEGEESNSQDQESGSEEENTTPAHAPKSEHVVRESSIDSIENRSFHEDDKMPVASAAGIHEMDLDEDADGDEDEEGEEDGVSEYQSNTPTTVHIRENSSAAEQPHVDKDESVEYESMDVDKTAVSLPNLDDEPATVRDTDNLDGLLEKLKSSETEAQPEPNDTVSHPKELKDDDNVEKISAPHVNLVEDGENSPVVPKTAEISGGEVEDESHDSAKLDEVSESHDEVQQDEPSASAEEGSQHGFLDDQTLPNQPLVKNLFERNNSQALQTETSSPGELVDEMEVHDEPVLQDTSTVTTPAKAASKSLAKIDQASISGWSRTPRKQGSLFSSVFGVDGASEDDEDVDEDADEDTNEDAHEDTHENINEDTHGDINEDTHGDTHEDTHDEDASVAYPDVPADATADEDSAERLKDIPHPQAETDASLAVRRGSNGQLPTPDDTQKVTFSQLSDLSMSDQLQSQLQEELGEYEEDLESWHDSRDTQIEVDEKADDADILNDSDIDDDNSEIYEEAVQEVDQEVDQAVINSQSNLLDEAQTISADVDFAVDDSKDEEAILESTEVVAVSEQMVLDEVLATDTAAEDSNTGANEKETQEEHPVDLGMEPAVLNDVKAADTDAVGSDGEAIDTDVEVTKTEIIEVVHTETEQANNETTDFRQDDAERDKSEQIHTESVILRDTDMDLENESDDNHNSAQPETKVHVKEELIAETKLVVEEQSEDVESGVDTNEITQEEPPTTPRSIKGAQRATKAAKKSRKGKVITSPRKTRSQKTQPVVQTPTTPVKSDKENNVPLKGDTTHSIRSPSPILDKEETPHGHDVSAQLALESLDSPVKAGHHLRGATDPRVRLNRYFRTELSEFTSLNGLRPKKNSRIDVLAVVTSIPPEPQKAKSGPKHYLTTFTVIDQSTFPNTVVEVVVYRPYKDALPTPVVGDGVLLRDFTVVAAKGKGFSLKSEEGSSWAVFKEEGTEVEVKGPPVEFGHAEKKHVKDLKEWFHGLDDASREQVQKVTAVMEAKSAAKGQSPEKTKK